MCILKNKYAWILLTLTFVIKASVHDTGFDRLRKTGALLGASIVAGGLYSFKRPLRSIGLISAGSATVFASLFSDMVCEATFVTLRALYLLEQHKFNRTQQKQRDADAKNHSWLKRKVQRVSNKAKKTVEVVKEGVSAATMTAEAKIRKTRAENEIEYSKEQLNDATEFFKQRSLLSAFNRWTNGLFHYVRGIVRKRIWIFSGNIVAYALKWHEEKMAQKRALKRENSQQLLLTKKEQKQIKREKSKRQLKAQKELKRENSRQLLQEKKEQKESKKRSSSLRMSLTRKLSK